MPTEDRELYEKLIENDVCYICIELDNWFDISYCKECPDNPDNKEGE